MLIDNEGVPYIFVLSSSRQKTQISLYAYSEARCPFLFVPAAGNAFRHAFLYGRIATTFIAFPGAWLSGRSSFEVGSIFYMFP